MKRLLAIILSTIFMTGSIGCTQKEIVSIDAYQWNITTIQNKNGEVIGGYYEYLDDNSDMEIRLSCYAEEGTFTIEDYTNIDYYEGNYQIEEENSKSIIYNITIDDNSGTAVTSITEDNNGNKIPTMVMTVDNYTLNFQAE